MSEVTGSTNVDNSKNNNKYLEDIKNGIPSVNGVCEHVADKGATIEIAVDPRMSGRATGDTIRDFGEVNIVVHTVSREEFNKLKETLKAKQAEQEKALFGENQKVSEEKDHDNDQEK